MKRQITIKPEGKTVYCEAGSQLLEVLQQEGYAIESTCGGRGRCGKCTVHIGSNACVREVLSCTTIVDSDLIVRLPAQEKFLDRKSILLQKHTFPVETNLIKRFLRVEEATIHDGRGDLDRILAKLDLEVEVNLAVIQQASEVMRNTQEGCTVVLNGRRVMAIEQGDTTQELFGVAFDIGTTTVAASLCDLTSGKVLITLSATNPQRQHGGDLISRITFANETPQNTKKLQKEIARCLNELIAELCQGAKVNRNHIYFVTIVGNTCMHHLFLGLNPKQLAIAPYVPVVQRSVNVSPEKIGLAMNAQGVIHVLPNIAGFVGADTVGVILATDLEQVRIPTLAIDLGTNGEIVLNSGQKMVACSTAAGPAFEGAQIAFGMRAAEGAIEKVSIDEQVLKLQVIGNSKIKGICGSGLIDLIAQLVQHGIIEASGRIIEPSQLLPQVAFLKERLVSNGKSFDFVLAFPDESSTGEAILLTQKDVRELQLAKGAILAGIKILLQEADLKIEDIAQVYLAGAFGNYIQVESALGIGLFPPIEAKRVLAAGNGASLGAIKALFSDQEKERAAKLVKDIVHIELATKAEFQKEFIDSLAFPKT